MRERIEFQERTSGKNALGGVSDAWSAQFERAAAFDHLRGDETVEAARLAGREVYRVKVRAGSATRAITAGDWRIRDTRRDKVFNIVSVDSITSRAWVWMRVEAG